MKSRIFDMVLTSILNNDKLLNDIITDVEERFKTKLDRQKLEAYLNTVEIEYKEPINVF